MYKERPQSGAFLFGGYMFFDVTWGENQIAVFRSLTKALTMVQGLALAGVAVKLVPRKAEVVAPKKTTK